MTNTATQIANSPPITDRRISLVNATQRDLDLTASWITTPDVAATSDSKPNNYTFLARKVFTVSEVPDTAILHITADVRYVAYVNGHCVGIGPMRGSDLRYYVDSYDVAAALNEGDNYLAIRVYCPVSTCNTSATPVMPAVCAQLGTWTATDATWQVQTDPSYRTDTFWYTHHIGRSEYRDLRKDPVGWQTFNDDSPQWVAACEVAAAAKLGDRVLTPRNLGKLSQEQFYPTSIIKTCRVPAHDQQIDDDLEYAKLMQDEEHQTSPQPAFENVENLLQGQATRVLPDDRGSGALAILDFGQTLVGHVILNIDVPAESAGAILDIGYDEAEVDGRISPWRKTVSDAFYRFADRYILRAGQQRIELLLHSRGFRMMQLTLRRFAAPITISEVQLATSVYPYPLEGSFESDQPLANQLWTMCTKTVAQCCMETFIDSPWREQTFWMDDQLFTNVYYLTATSDKTFPARNLIYGIDSAMPDGMIPARYPTTSGMLFPSMPSVWTLTIYDYYLYTGDQKTVEQLLPTMDKTLKVYDPWREPDGLVADQEELWNFIDWAYDLAGAALGGKTAVLNMFIAAAYKCAAALHDACNNSARADEYREISRQTVQAVYKTFWSEQGQYLRDCTETSDKEQTYRFHDNATADEDGHTFSQHPHALGIYYDLLDDKQRAAAVNTILHPRVIVAEYNFQRFVLQALVVADHGLDAWKTIHNLYGDMARSGAPTVWEAKAGQAPWAGCGSLCQASSSAPMNYFHTCVLGIKPLKPGFEEFTIAPQRCDFQWAKGDIPTPQGCIHISWKSLNQDELMVDINVPKGLTGVMTNGRRLESGHHQITLPTT